MRIASPDPLRPFDPVRQPESVISASALIASSVPVDSVPNIVVPSSIPSFVKKRFDPKEHQVAASDAVCASLQTNDRCKLIMACGTGKTYTSLMIKEKLLINGEKPKITLFLAPSLQLIRQTRKSWDEQATKKFNYHCICSDSTTALDVDPAMNREELKELKRESEGKVTTDPTIIRDVITQAKSRDEDLVLYATYDSLNKITEALQGTGMQIDLVICDEAHNTASSKEASTALVHDKEKLPAAKRVYMTATERILDPDVARRIQGGEAVDAASINVCSMDDPTIFGPEAYKVSFAYAIEHGLITDYKLLAMGISRKEMDRLGIKEDSPELLSLILDRAMKSQGASHALSFHSRNDRAKQFQEVHSKRMVEQQDNTQVFHINGEMPVSQRVEILDSFAAAASAVTTNARCLGEGVDVPLIDLIYFCDSSDSVVRIVQASSRALRLDSNNPDKIGYILLPVIYEDEDDIAGSIREASRGLITRTVSALADSDERLAAALQVSSGNGDREKFLAKHVEILALGSEGLTSLDIRSQVLADSQEIRGGAMTIKEEGFRNFALRVKALLITQNKIPEIANRGELVELLKHKLGLVFSGQIDQLARIYMGQGVELSDYSKFGGLYTFLLREITKLPEVEPPCPVQSFEEAITMIQQQCPQYSRIDSLKGLSEFFSYSSETNVFKTTGISLGHLRDLAGDPEINLRDLYNKIFPDSYQSPIKVEVPAIASAEELYDLMIAENDGKFARIAKLRERLPDISIEPAVKVSEGGLRIYRVGKSTANVTIASNPPPLGRTVSLWLQGLIGQLGLANDFELIRPSSHTDLDPLMFLAQPLSQKLGVKSFKSLLERFVGELSEKERLLSQKKQREYTDSAITSWGYTVAGFCSDYCGVRGISGLFK